MALRLHTTEKLSIAFATLAALFSSLGAVRQVRRGASPLLGELVVVCCTVGILASLMAARARQRRSMPPAP